MTHRPDEADRAPEADHVTDEIFRAIASPPPVPDLTAPIMGRLGYMRAAPAVVRRRRRRRAILRGATCLVTGAVIGAALYVHEIGPNARRPGGPSIPAVIGREVEQTQRGFNRAIQTIRDLSPVRPAPAGTAEPSDRQRDDLQNDWPLEWKLDEDVDRSAVGPVRWL